MPLLFGSGVARCRGCSHPAVAGMSDCLACAATSIDDPGATLAPLGRVRRALAEWGVVTPRPVRLELRSNEVMTRALGNAAVTGITRTLRLTDGTFAGPTVVSVRAGLPAHLFEAVAAHELTHTATVGPKRLPPVLDEGLAEYVAFRYLAEVLRTAPALAYAEVMAARRGDHYGDGLQLVMRLVRREGFAAVWDTAQRRVLGAAP